MRKLTMFAVPCLMLVGACTSSPAPLPPPVPIGGSVAPSSPVVTSPVSPTPDYPAGTTVINGCPIMADAECPEAELSRSQIPEADLRRANLTGANLSGSDLRKTDFSDSNLASANLRNSDLTGANLSSADLTGASFKFANVTATNFSGSNLSSSNLAKLELCRTILPDGRRDDSGCPENPGSTTDTTDTGPTIVVFTVSSTVVCTGTLTTVTVPAHWETKAAKTVTFEANGTAFPAEQVFAKSGDDLFEFPCKKEKVTYTLVATDAAGYTTQRSATTHRAV